MVASPSPGGAGHKQWNFLSKDRKPEWRVTT